MMSIPGHGHETQDKRVRRYLEDNPTGELSQAQTAHWRPPIHRLGAVIWRLRHIKGVDIVKRTDTSGMAHYRLAPEPEPLDVVKKCQLPFSSIEKKDSESLLDLVAQLSQVAEQLAILVPKVTRALEQKSS